MPAGAADRAETCSSFTAKEEGAGSGRGQSRPRKVKTLANTINSLLTQKLQEKELTAIIDSLQQKKYIVVKDGNVSYKLPK